tara:strand:- start:269 stop:460 length:192 start_codon:yes stop_codon:yes gene_type:complete
MDQYQGGQPTSLHVETSGKDVSEAVPQKVEKKVSQVKKKVSQIKKKVSQVKKKVSQEIQKEIP